MEGYTEIFCWGGDYFGQLGLGQNKTGNNYALPRFCSFNVLIRKLSCGEEHTGFISEEGHVYMMGSNSSGRLGLNDRSLYQTSSPCLVESLLPYRIQDISCGGAHSLAASDSGIAFSWGLGDFGALGTGGVESQWLPIKLRLTSFQRVLQVSAGGRHSGFIAEDTYGQISLMMCGAGDSGQLATGRRDHEVNLVIVNTPEPIKQLACGNQHSLFLTRSGRVFAAGNNSNGQLGTGSKKNSSLMVQSFGLDRVEKIACRNSSAAVTDRGELYLWGTGGFGSFNKPHRVDLEHRIIDASLGLHFGLVLDSQHKVFAWGDNKNGELAQGNSQYVSGIVPVNSLRGKYVTKLCCGGNFSVCLGKDVINEGEERRKLSRQQESTHVKIDDQTQKIKELEGQLLNAVTHSQTYMEEATSIENKMQIREREHVAECEKFLARIDHLEIACKRQQTEHGNLENILAEERLLKEKMSSQLAAHTKEVEDLRRQIDHMRMNQVESNSKNEHFLTEISASRNQIEELRSEKEKMFSENLELSESNRRLTRKIDEIQYTSQMEFSNKIKEFEDQTDKLKENFALQAKSADFKYHQLEATLQKTKLDYEEKIKYLEEALDSTIKDKEQIYMKAQVSSTDIEKLQREIDHKQSISRSEISTLTNKLEMERSQYLELQKTANQANNETLFLQEEISKLQKENTTLKSSMDELSYKLEKINRENSDHQYTLQKSGQSQKEMNEVIEHLKVENRQLHEDVADLEAKNRQLFDNLQKELAQRAREYKERTMSMLGTPMRNPTSPYQPRVSLTPATPPLKTEPQNQSPRNTASDLLNILNQHSPRYLASPSRKSYY